MNLKEINNKTIATTIAKAAVEAECEIALVTRSNGQYHTLTKEFDAVHWIDTRDCESRDYEEFAAIAIRNCFNHSVVSTDINFAEAWASKVLAEWSMEACDHQVIS